MTTFANRSQVQNNIVFIGIDLETTGLNANVHSICQLAMCVFDIFHDIEEYVTDVYETCAENLFDQHAFDVNGFDRNRLMAGTHISQVMRRFIEIHEKTVQFAKKTDREVVFIAQNAKFDADFLTQTFRRGYPTFNIDTLLRYFLCTASIGFAVGISDWRKVPSLKVSYNTVFEQDPVGHHDALEDARSVKLLTRAYMKRLMTHMP